jgi:hypothetical protein
MERPHGSVGCSFVLGIRLCPVRDVVRGAVILFFGLLPILVKLPSMRPSLRRRVDEMEKRRYCLGLRGIQWSAIAYISSHGLTKIQTSTLTLPNGFTAESFGRQVPDSILVIVSKPEWPNGRTTLQAGILPTPSTDSPAH